MDLIRQLNVHRTTAKNRYAGSVGFQPIGSRVNATNPHTAW